MQASLTKPLIGILAVSVVVAASAGGYFHDQSIKAVYSSLTPEIYDLENQVDGRDAQISSLQNTVSNRDTQITQLQNAHVEGWFTFSGTQCYYSCYVRGAYANYGTEDARNIILTLTWKNSGAFVQSNTISLANLAGRSTALYPIGSSEQYFSLAAPANQLTWSFTWTVTVP